MQAREVRVQTGGILWYLPDPVFMGLDPRQYADFYNSIDGKMVANSIISGAAAACIGHVGITLEADHTIGYFHRNSHTPIVHNHHDIDVSSSEISSSNDLPNTASNSHGAHPLLKRSGPISHSDNDGTMHDLIYMGIAVVRNRSVRTILTFLFPIPMC